MKPKAWMTGAALSAMVAVLTGPLLVTSANAGPGAHGPNGEHLDAAGATTGSGLARLPDGSVQIPKLAQRRMGIRTVVSIATDAAASLELPGRVVMDPNAGGRVQAVHGGRLEPGPRGLPVPGQRVRAGEVLAYLRHHADPIAQANQQAQVAELRANRTILQQRVQRLESLEGTVPRKEIEAARAELQGLLARERSVSSSLNSRETLVSPLSGVIARADAVRGQVVESRDVLFEVVDPTRVLVEATTTDPSLVGKVAAATVRNAPGVQLQLVGTARSLREGVLPLTFRAAGSFVTALAVGQPVTVVVHLQDKVKGLVLPAQAIVRNPNNEPVVWIKSGAERFIPQPVQYRTLDAQTVVVTKGLAPDNRVVVQGAALIAQIR
jgi:cobalt-zinc-cadmium efflux system membrane fusion protein